MQSKHKRSKSKYFVGYARVSTDEQRDSGVSLPDQRHRITAYAEARGYELLGIEEDTASGAVPPSKRPGLSRALSTTRRGLADGLIILRLDRLSRKTLVTLSLLEEADRLGWMLVSLHESLDTSTPVGGLVVTIFAGVAEMERKQIGERTRAAMAQVAREGRARSRWLPFGFRIEGEPESTTLTAGDRRALVPHEPEQRILKRVLRMRRLGMGGHAIATALNERQIINPRTGRAWSPSGMRSLIRTAEKRLTT